MTDACSANNNDNICKQNRGSQLVAGPKAPVQKREQLKRGTGLDETPSKPWAARLRTSRQNEPHKELQMNPMSILTLPASTLREAYLHAGAPASCGERTERRVALIACAVAVVGALAFFLA